MNTTVYYLCPEHPTPVGGVRIIYRHVDILNQYGIRAYVVHQTPGFRVTWFENTTPIVYWRNNPITRLHAKIKRRADPAAKIELPILGGIKKTIGNNDILVVPELYGPDLAAANGRGIKKVILNQNCYLTFNGYSFNRDRLITPYGHPDVLGTLINSEDGEAYLSHAFPDLPLFRFRLSIDPAIFKFSAEKKKQICFSQIKNKTDALQVINILKFRGLLNNYTLTPFINLPQRDVARIYSESLMFLSFGYPEGFGLPAAEAMASGCVVVGFHGGGGKEFFRPEFSYPIEQGNILQFAKTIEQLITDYDTSPDPLLKKGRMAADFIRERYSPEKEESDVIAAWKKILEPEAR